ncbi:hypothetical protein B9Z55_011837 [Caenorhabditis nigoni]|uniref:Uncharacterized protein n=1 Tax=Caenorhabditis nigoni TaxID=1611254 RepID=A0A2G5ULY2_9PELO|nr:hypothetical protein B9Z55_011837 [Caenorhabditis nigoni]
MEEWMANGGSTWQAGSWMEDLGDRGSLRFASVGTMWIGVRRWENAENELLLLALGIQKATSSTRIHKEGQCGITEDLQDSRDARRGIGKDLRTNG